LNALRKRHGLAPLNDLRELYTAGDFCAYLDIPELLPLPHMPEGHFYLGPLAWRPRGQPLMDLGRPKAGRPLAYVSMGSSGDESLLPQVAQALTELGFDAVYSGVDPDAVARWAEGGLESASSRRAARLVDPDQVLPGATLTICHAGSGTVYQSLAWGVPLLCLPDNPDQGLIAQAVEASGAGISLHPDRVSLDRLKRILTQHFLEGNALRERARGLSRSLAMWDTRGRWVNWLGSFFGTAGSWRGNSLPSREAVPVPTW
jgi:UDP:flavonoid glycosyltransferase YjiC (YdhE family)